MRAVIHSNSEPGEAHIQSDDSTHSGSDLGKAHSQNDDYIFYHSELGAAHIRDDDFIVPFTGIQKVIMQTQLCYALQVNSFRFYLLSNSKRG